MFLWSEEMFSGAPSQDGDVGRHGSPLCTTTSKSQLKSSTPSLRNVRNQVEWKADNYRIEETTSIQNGRRGTDMARAGPTPMWTKILEGHLRSEESQTHIRPPAQRFQCQEDKSPHFWLRKPAGIESVKEAAGALSSSSWGTLTWTHLLRLAPSEFQHQGGSFKGPSGIQGETEESAVQVSKGHCPFAWPSRHRPSRLVPYLRLHQPG